MTNPKKYRSEILQNALNRISPLEKQKVEERMLLAIRLKELMTERGLNNTKFAEKVGKNNSEVTKWLSGTHNFTTDVLTEIAFALGVNLKCLFESRTVEAGIYVLSGSMRVNFEPSEFQTKRPNAGESNWILTAHTSSQVQKAELQLN